MVPMEDIFVICMPVDIPDHYITPGSKEYDCADCGRRIHASPSSQRMIEQGEAIPLCLLCGSLRAKENPDANVGIAPGAIKEIEKWRQQRRRN